MDSKNPSGAKSRAEVYDWIQCIIFALVFCVLLFVFAVRMVNVVGHSMVPTLEQSDKVEEYIATNTSIAKSDAVTVSLKENSGDNYSVDVNKLRVEQPDIYARYRVPAKKYSYVQII